jgi:hypothetical protein
LEGWVRPATAAELARDAGVPAPDGGWDRALRMTEPADLTVYLGHVAAGYPVLGSAKGLSRVARESVEDAAADGCDYLEMRFGPSTHRRPGFDLAAVIAATCEGLADGSAATGLPSGLVVCLLRHDDDETNLAVARAAVAAAGSGVVGARHLQHVDHVRIRGGRAHHLADAEHDRRVRDATRQDDALGVGRDQHVLTGKELVNLLLERAHRLLHDHVVLDAPGVTPDDQADRAGRLAVDQDLASGDDGRIGDLVVRDRDPGHVEVGRQNRRPAGRERNLGKLRLLGVQADGLHE